MILTDASGAKVVARDRRRGRFDLTVPTLPTAICAPGASSGCLVVEDDDERDCRIGRVCVEASTDAVALDMTYCGTTRTVRLAREGTLMCARDVTFIGTREGSASSRPFTATAVDDAGNRSAPGAYDQAAACPLPPGRFAGGATTAAAHVRGAAGPIAMTASGGSLVVSTWNGRAWNALLVHTPSGGPWIFRGRADGITLSDGSALFCATRRHPSTFDFLDVGDDMLETGILDVVHVPAGGGSPRVVRIADVAALGCALDQSPTGSRQVGVAYAERVFSSPPADVPIRAALTECALDASGLACTASAAFRATATREGLMGLDIDLAYSSAGAPFAVGRGRRAPDGTVTEHAVYLVRGGISVVTLQSQTRAYECIRPRVDPLDAIVPDSWFDASVTMVPPERTITLATGALTPRIVRESTGRFGVTMTRYEQSAVVRDQSDRMTAETETRFEAVAMLIAASGALVPGSSRSLGLQHLSDSPPSLLWAYGDFALPRPGTAGLCGVPSSDADVPSAPPTDLEGDGRTAVAIWAIRNVATARQRPELRISDRLFAIRGREIENGPTAALRGFSHSSSLQRTTIPLLPGTAFAPTTALLDAEVGNRNQIADLALGRGASAISSPSAFYDRWSPSDDTGRDFFHDMLYAEARAGQFLVGPDGAASPGAEDSCVANLMSVVPVTDSQLLLVPEPPPIDPPTPQYPWTSMQMGLAALNANFANTSAGLTCQVNQLVESTLGPGAVDDVAFDIPVQTNVVQPLLSFATTLGGSTTTMRTPTTPAMLLSNRFDLATATLGPGTLTLVVNGTALPAVSLPGPTPIVAAVEALNTALGAAPGRPFVALAPIGPDPRTPVAARVALLAYPTGSAEATLSVRPGGIATRLGVPIGPVARSSRQIDIAFGDTSDRFRPCAEWTPCTPGPRGTCSLAEDCIPTGTSLLAEVLEGVRLREGRVPLRSQLDVCVPTTQLSAPNTDACEPGGPAYRGGIASSYVSQSISGRDGCRTAAGEGAAGGRCLTCGRPAPASSTDPLDRAGAPRRCSTDDDCQPSRTCTARSCPATTNMLCTHMDGIYMGVPAGEGFCASPASCSIGTADCIARDGLPATRGILGVASGAFPRPVNPRRAFIVEGVVHAIGDFRPGLPTASGGGVECTLHGCAACIGDEVNGYCRSDAECPPDHSCLTRARGGFAPPDGTPLCVLRPLLEDGRLRRAETELATTTDPGVAELANTVLPALAGVRAQIASSASALRVPLRFAFDVDVLGEVRIDRVEAEIARAVAAWHDVPVVAPDGYSYGSSQLWMTIGIQDDIRVAGRTRLGPLTARFNVAAIQLRFAPYVGSDHHLAMRLVGARMLREFDEHSLEIEPSALDLNFEGEFRANLFGALFILKSLFTFAAVPGAVAVFDEVVSSLEEGLDLSILTQVGLGELGGFIAPVIERTGQDLVFGTLFGAETIAAPTSLLENAWAHSSPGSLDLRFRGPVINLRGLITGLAIAPVTSPVGACCQARDFDRTPEPDPNCLQAGGTVAACVAAQVAACGP